MKEKLTGGQRRQRGGWLFYPDAEYIFQPHSCRNSVPRRISRLTRIQKSPSSDFIGIEKEIMKATTCFLGGLLVFSNFAYASILGGSDDFNVFVLGNTSMESSTIQGKLASGSLTSLLNTQISASQPSKYALVTGGNLDNITGSTINGGIYVNGNANLEGCHIDGNIVTTGNATIENSTYKNLATKSDITPPVDFASESNKLLHLSESLAEITSNGTTSISQDPLGTTITLKSTSANNFNYFSIDLSDINNASALNFNIGADDLAIINITNYTNSEGLTWSTQHFLNYDGKENHILFNIPTACDIYSAGAHWVGTILAPKSSAAFKNSSISGSMFVNQLSADGLSAGSNPFSGNLMPVPEPSSLSFLLIGLYGLLFVKRRRV
jgi:choice-of-anchor A domain-containing protein